MGNELERHALTYGTEIGSLKIEIEADLPLFKNQKLFSSDSFYLKKIQEISNQINFLKEQKEFNDEIWTNIKFKTNTGQIIYFYRNHNILISIISPDEWPDMSQYFIGKFILNTDGIWEKN